MSLQLTELKNCVNDNIACKWYNSNSIMVANIEYNIEESKHFELIFCQLYNFNINIINYIIKYYSLYNFENDHTILHLACSKYTKIIKDMLEKKSDHIPIIDNFIIKLTKIININTLTKNKETALHMLINSPNVLGELGNVPNNLKQITIDTFPYFCNMIKLFLENGLDTQLFNNDTCLLNYFLKHTKYYRDYGNLYYETIKLICNYGNQNIKILYNYCFDDRAEIIIKILNEYGYNKHDHIFYDNIMNTIINLSPDKIMTSLSIICDLIENHNGKQYILKNMHKYMFYFLNSNKCSETIGIPHIIKYHDINNPTTLLTGFNNFINDLNYNINNDDEFMNLLCNKNLVYNNRLIKYYYNHDTLFTLYALGFKKYDKLPTELLIHILENFQLTNKIITMLSSNTKNNLITHFNSILYSHTINHINSVRLLISSNKCPALLDIGSILAKIVINDEQKNYTKIIHFYKNVNINYNTEWSYPNACYSYKEIKLNDTLLTILIRTIQNDYTLQNKYDNYKNNKTNTNLKFDNFKKLYLIIKELRKCGLNISRRDNDGNTVLHRLINENYTKRSFNFYSHEIKIFKILLKCGINVNIENNDNLTILHLASKELLELIFKYKTMNLNNNFSVPLLDYYANSYINKNNLITISLINHTIIGKNNINIDYENTYHIIRLLIKNLDLANKFTLTIDKDNFLKILDDERTEYDNFLDFLIFKGYKVSKWYPLDLINIMINDNNNLNNYVISKGQIIFNNLCWSLNDYECKNYCVDIAINSAKNINNVKNINMANQILNYRTFEKCNYYSSICCFLLEKINITFDNYNEKYIIDYIFKNLGLFENKQFTIFINFCKYISKHNKNELFKIMCSKCTCLIHLHILNYLYSNEYIDYTLCLDTINTIIKHNEQPLNDDFYNITIEEIVKAKEHNRALEFTRYNDNDSDIVKNRLTTMINLIVKLITLLNQNNNYDPIYLIYTFLSKHNIFIGMDKKILSKKKDDFVEYLGLPCYMVVNDNLKLLLPTFKYVKNINYNINNRNLLHVIIDKIKVLKFKNNMLLEVIIEFSDKIIESQDLLNIINTDFINSITILHDFVKILLNKGININMVSNFDYVFNNDDSYITNPFFELNNDDDKVIKLFNNGSVLHCILPVIEDEQCYNIALMLLNSGINTNLLDNNDLTALDILATQNNKNSLEFAELLLGSSINNSTLCSANENFLKLLLENGYTIDNQNIFRNDNFDDIIKILLDINYNFTNNLKIIRSLNVNNDILNIIKSKTILYNQCNICFGLRMVIQCNYQHNTCFECYKKTKYMCEFCHI